MRKKLQTPQHTSILKVRLRQFGLNPNDWCLKIKGQAQAFVQNKREPSTVLKGHFDPKTFRWESLDLIAI